MKTTNTVDGFMKTTNTVDGFMKTTNTERVHEDY